MCARTKVLSEWNSLNEVEKSGRFWVGYLVESVESIIAEERSAWTATAYQGALVGAIGAAGSDDNLSVGAAGGGSANGLPAQAHSRLRGSAQVGPHAKVEPSSS